MICDIRFTQRDAKRVFAALILAEAVLVTIFSVESLLGKPSYSFHALFDLDGEACVPAWFSSMQLFVIGFVLLGASRIRSEASAPAPWFLALLGVGFIFLSADEAGMIHERLNAMARKADLVPRYQGPGAWITLYFIAGGSFIVASWRQILSLFTVYRRESAIALAGFGTLVFGAVGLEMFSFHVLGPEPSPAAYIGEVVCEEFFEMCGTSIVLYAALLLALRRSAAVPGTATVPESRPVAASVPSLAATEPPLPLLHRENRTAAQ